MAWTMKGRYFENCSCDMPCPCTASFDAGADLDRCNALLVFSIDEAEVNGVDLGGTTVAVVLDTPKVMTDGEWRIGLVIDDEASDAQVEQLTGVFGGGLGGPMAALGPLVGEQLGVERLPMEVVEQDGRHALRAGDAIDVEVDELVPFGVEDGTPARLVGVAHPAGDTLTIARTSQARWNVFGLAEEHGPRTSGFAAPFAWAG